MLTTHDYHLIEERIPEAWALSRVTSAGAAIGNAVYPTPAYALADAASHDPHAEFEIHLRADDPQVDVQLRDALLILRDAGMTHARQVYSVSEAKLARIGLTDAGFAALTARSPYLGAPPAVIKWTADDEINLELAVVVQGDAP